MTESTVNLPKTTGPWTRPQAPRIIDSSNIFKYMNGGGELYLAFRFSHMALYEYTADQKDNILVEIYVMETSDDAFGLLSLDWGGETVPIPFSSPAPDAAAAPGARALYGGGLLRMGAGTLFARVMAYLETPESREAVLSLGRAIGAGQKSPAEPGLLKRLPHTIGTEWKLRKNRSGYFRSHLVLNALYYISHQNILNLDLSTEAVTAPYELTAGRKTPERLQLLLVRYASQEKALQALARFHHAYLPDHSRGPESGAAGPHIFQIEDGWLGYGLTHSVLAIAFECPDKRTAQTVIKQTAMEPAQKRGK